MSYWDFNNIDEALKTLHSKVEEIRNDIVLTTTTDEHKKLINDIKQARIAYKKSKKKQEKIDEKIVKYKQ